MLQYVMLGVLILTSLALVWLLIKRAKSMGWVKRALLALAFALNAAGFYVLQLMWTTVDPVPEGGKVTEPLDEGVDHLAVSFPEQGPLEELTLRDLKGKVAFFLVDDRKSMQVDEATKLRRAMSRWVYPDDVVGFNVGAAPNMPGIMRRKIEKDFVGFMRSESPRPIYVDFGAEMQEVFKLPKGHFALLVLDREGEIAMRHSGDADATRIEEIRTLLEATEPPPPPPAPEFSFEGYDNARCKAHPKGCVFVFLDEAVARKDVPEIEGGFESKDPEESFGQFRKASVRNARLVVGDWEMNTTKAEGMFVGELADDLKVDGWAVHADAAPLREAFGVAPGEAAMVIIDHEGRLAFSEKGLIPLWKFGLAGDVLGVEAKRPEPKD